MSRQGGNYERTDARNQYDKNGSDHTGKRTRNQQNSSRTRGRKSKKWLVFLVLVLLLAAGGGAWWWFTQNPNTDGGIFGSLGGGSNTTPIYSNLTGLEITDASQNNLPTFCIQIPNGSTDGARPQVGLDRAAVIFEAIAETGITRFAAIYNDPPVMVGPIRSLRPYYLDWDTPFDCTVVHDGGSQEALAAVGNGRYRNLDEDFNYMWKVNYIEGQYRYWNNVFTSHDLLYKFNNSKNYTTSSPKTFPRLTPDEAVDIANRQTRECTEDEANCAGAKTPLIAQIRTAFTGISDYIVHYQYDASTNTYLRFYENGGAHQTYTCSNQVSDPPAGCTLRQVAPSAVAIMRVRENTMADGYHEQIQTIGSGEAYVFQNGELIKGKWQKASQAEQIKFTDTEGNEIKFTPGQLWIAAVPQFGDVNWE